MSILHLCNTFFEWELVGKTPPSLTEAICQTSIFQQLQFLPLLYANPGDGILVTAKPEEKEADPFFLLEEESPHQKLQTWGHSLLAKEWAEKKGIAYLMPPWDVVKMVNSKTYSFTKSPLPGARLIFRGDPLSQDHVLKSCFGMAGQGLLLANHPKAKVFCQQQWDLGLPVLSEPWVERTLDFSTQWEISTSGEIAFLGATLCKTSQTGIHLSNSAGMKESEMIEQQKAFVMEVLQEMADMGYFGEVGIDAMVYGSNQLQPIVEINARKTMGWVTLMLQKKKHPEKIVELSYIPSKEAGLLPRNLGKVNFSKQAIITIQ